MHYWSLCQYVDRQWALGCHQSFNLVFLLSPLHSAHRSRVHLGNGGYKNNTKSNQFEYSAGSILVKIFDVQEMTKKAAVILPNQFADQAPSAGASGRVLQIG